MSKKVKQDLIPKKIIEMAKFIQKCDGNKRSIIVIQKRDTGKTAAFKLARNNS